MIKVKELCQFQRKILQRFLFWLQKNNSKIKHNKSKITIKRSLKGTTSTTASIKTIPPNSPSFENIVKDPSNSIISAKQNSHSHISFTSSKASIKAKLHNQTLFLKNSKFHKHHIQSSTLMKEFGSRVDLESSKNLIPPKFDVSKLFLPEKPFLRPNYII